MGKWSQVSCILRVAAAAAAVTLAASCRRAAQDAARAVAGALPLAEMPSCMLVYERPSGIWLRDMASTQAVLLAANGSWPRFSPDGRQVAFVRGDAVMRVSVRGGEPERLATVSEGRAVAWSDGGREVLFTDGAGKSVRGVVVSNLAVRGVAEGWNFLELDATADGSRMVATVRSLGSYSIRAFDLKTGRDRELASGCSASISPDGARVTNNGDEHTKLLLREWDSGKVSAEVSAPAGTKCDNQFWSNHGDWLVSVTEGKRTDVLVHHIPSDRCLRVTDEGDCDRPDLFVRE